MKTFIENSKKKTQNDIKIMHEKKNSTTNLKKEMHGIKDKYTDVD